MNILQGLGLVKDTLGTWVGSWAKRQELKVQTETRVKELRAEIELKKVESGLRVTETGQRAEIDWDLRMAEASQTSWKDEVMMLAIIGPYLAIFHPDFQPIVIEGFKALEKLPDWYKVSFGVVVAASFGYRGVMSVFSRFGKPPGI